jgi:SAM-dependent methyltransferase
MTDTRPVRRTAEAGYADHLIGKQTAPWKRVLNVQFPYQWNVRRLGLGTTLDVGCGIGRNLCHLPAGSIGVDHNERAVEYARARGLPAMTAEEFFASSHDTPVTYDSLLVAHVAEHASADDAVALLATYATYLRPGGRAVLITPQERGFASDPTHVEFMDFDKLTHVLQRAGFGVERCFSFPFPRWAGSIFPYNEFVVVGRKP